MIAFGLIVLGLAHPIVIEEDLRRRGLYEAGCLYVLAALALPPLGAALYLAATYREKALVLVPLYFGVLGVPFLGAIGASYLV